MARAEQVFESALDEALPELQLSLDPAARAKILSHYRLLELWNRRISLTTIRDPRETALRHFGEALFLARELPEDLESVLDVGSGPGFPGLPLAAARPALWVTLLESVQRKAVFLREVSRGWANVDVRNERLEGLSGHWDACVMRAVSVEEALPHLARTCSHVALLLGEEDAGKAAASGLFDWDSAVRVPWSARRVLLRGKRAEGCST